VCRQYPRLSATLVSPIDELEARIARLPRRNDWDLNAADLRKKGHEVTMEARWKPR
jgi:hypothetical protein